MKSTESILQQSCIRWFDDQYPALRQRLFAIPNGGHRHVAVAAKMKREGVRKGIPDLMLLLPTQEYSGLFIELKADKGKLTKEQKVFIETVGQDYKCHVIRSLDDFRAVVDGWIKDNKNYQT